MSESNYTSSIVNKYGDRDKVPADVQVLFEILSRQGSSLLIDTLAEYVANTCNKLRLEPKERERLVSNLVAELVGALSERT